MFDFGLSNGLKSVVRNGSRLRLILSPVTSSQSQRLDQSYTNGFQPVDRNSTQPGVP